MLENCRAAIREGEEHRARIHIPASPTPLHINKLTAGFCPYHFDLAVFQQVKTHRMPEFIGAGLITGDSHPYPLGGAGTQRICESTIHGVLADLSPHRAQGVRQIKLWSTCTVDTAGVDEKISGTHIGIYAVLNRCESNVVYREWMFGIYGGADHPAGWEVCFQDVPQILGKVLHCWIRRASQFLEICVLQQRRLNFVVVGDARRGPDEMKLKFHVAQVTDLGVIPPGE